MSFDFFKSLFDIKRVECAGVDGVIFKVHLVAKREGMIGADYIGVNLVVRGKGEGLIVEVKRSGLLVDRYVDLEMRLGDSLVVYV